MSIRVQIPAPLRSLTGGSDEVQVEAGDVGALVEALEAKHKGLKDRLCDPAGELRAYVRVFVNVKKHEGKTYDFDAHFKRFAERIVKKGHYRSLAEIKALAGKAGRDDSSGYGRCCGRGEFHEGLLSGPGTGRADGLTWGGRTAFASHRRRRRWRWWPTR